jgi:ubiquinone/menaquinone biosynthesis C-methylase UbiE
MRLDVFPWLYDLVMRTVEEGPLARWRASVVQAARGRVLEIGAGTGLDFRHYEHGVTVVATDVDIGMLARARTRVATANATVLLVAADAEALPFRAGAFDDAVIGLALCSIPDPSNALAEVCRTVRSGGAVRLLEHVRAQSHIVGRLQDWVTPVWARLAGGCHLNRDAVTTVIRNGLTVERVIPHARGFVLEIFARTSRRPPQESVVRRLGVLAANRQLGKSAANVATAKVGTGASAIFSTPKCVGSSE